LNDHILIIGWTERTVDLIEELVLAAESEGGTDIVVLDVHEKSWLEDQLKDRIPSKKALKGSNVVFRTGSGTNVRHLHNAAASTAKAVVILADLGNPDKADALMLQVVLCLKGLEHKLKGHIVLEMQDRDNEALLHLVGGDCLETLISSSMMTRLLAMCTRQPHAAQVYADLLGFDNHEFYMKEWPDLYGVQFGEMQLRFPDAIPIGVKTMDGQFELNPEGDREYLEGEQLIVLAEDNDTYR
jgi:Trk K+ transport system NAD-binding subunit